MKVMLLRGSFSLPPLPSSPPQSPCTTQKVTVVRSHVSRKGSGSSRGEAAGNPPCEKMASLQGSEQPSRARAGQGRALLFVPTSNPILGTVAFTNSFSTALDSPRGHSPPFSTHF